MNIKKIFIRTFLLAMILILSFTTFVFATTQQVKVYVDNEQIKFDVEPIIQNGRVLIPLRGVFEKLDAKVDWNKDTLQAIIKDEYNEIILMLGKDRVLANKEIKEIDTTVKMLNSRVVVPLRFIGETLGHDVKWDEKTRSVYIHKNSSIPHELNTVLTVGSEENLIALLEYNSKLHNYTRTMNFVDSINEESMDLSSKEAPTSAPSQDDSSNTNNQVEGVEEGDIIKNDGKYIFINLKDSIKIIDSNPLNPKVISEIIVPENMNINEIFINKSKLTIIGQNNYYQIYNKNEIQLEKSMIMPNYENRCNVLIYNIENIEKLNLEREYLFDGIYNSSRTIDDNLYLVTTKYFDFRYYDVYKQERPNIQLPSYTDCKTNEKTEIGFDEIKYFPNYIDSKYMITVGINLNDGKSKPDVDAYIGSTQSIFVSKDNLYTTMTDYSYNSRITPMELYNPIYDVNTVIYKFNLKDGKVNVDSHGTVPGTIINQFSMDEHNGMLRIATNTGIMWQEGRNESKNNVYILNEKLNIIGKLEGLALGEKIYSTRFMGDKMYMVTFKQVDPLFVIDTSVPTNPKMLGYLKIPGYSTYLHPVDENHILGFGYEVSENQWGGTVNEGFKLTLFDVSNVSKPKEVATDVIGKSGTYSELLNNHKALMFSLNKKIMAFPIKSYDGNYKQDFAGAYIYNIDTVGFKLKSKISHMVNEEYNYNNEIKRIIYINDYLYTFSNNKMEIHNIDSIKKQGELIFN